MQRKFCFLDMDGVIADFVGATCKAHNLPSPYGSTNCAGVFEMEDCWGMTAEQFWKPLATFDFWYNLEKTPEADELVEYLIQKFTAKNICILTSPSSYGGCIEAKKAWMVKNFPIFSKQMLFGSAKEYLAGPDRFLVDDRTKNITAFTDAGGIGITVPRAWNHRHFHKDDVIREIKAQFYLAENY